MQFHLSTVSHRISERLLNLKLLTITHFHILAHTTLAGKHIVNLNHIRSTICLTMDDCHVAALLVAQSWNEISSKNDEWLYNSFQVYIEGYFQMYGCHKVEATPTVKCT